jgi:hypothetical protein
VQPWSSSIPENVPGLQTRIGFYERSLSRQHFQKHTGRACSYKYTKTQTHHEAFPRFHGYRNLMSREMWRIVTSFRSEWRVCCGVSEEPSIPNAAVTEFRGGEGKSPLYFSRSLSCRISVFPSGKSNFSCLKEQTRKGLRFVWLTTDCLDVHSLCNRHEMWTDNNARQDKVIFVNAFKF